MVPLDPDVAGVAVAGNILKVELEISESGHNSENVTCGNGGIC